MKKSFHYAWVNAAVCMLVLFACGTVCQTYGVFLRPIAADLGVGMGKVSGAITVLNCVVALSGPLAAGIVDRFGMRRVLPLALLGVAAALAALSSARTLAAVYILYAVCGCGLYYGLYFLCPYIVNRWYRTRVAETIALIITAMAVGGAVGNLVLGNLITAAGWRSAYRMEAIFLCAAAVIAFLLLRDDPADKGCRPFGAAEKTAGPVMQTDCKGGRGLTAVSALKRPEFHLLVFYVAAMQFCVGMQSQIPNLALSVGLSAAVGASAASVNSLGGIPAKALLSLLNVRIGVVRSVLLYNAVGIAGLLGILFFPNSVGIHLFAILFGFAIGSTTVQLPLMSNRLFGGSEAYGKIHARIVLISGLLATPSSLLAGTVYDKTGNYTLFLILLAVLLAAAAVLAARAWRLAGKDGGSVSA